MASGWTRWLNALQDRAESQVEENAYADAVAAAARAAAEVSIGAAPAAAEAFATAAAAASAGGEAIVTGVGPLTVDLGAARTYRITLTANCTLTLTGAVAGRRYDLVLIQDGSGSHTMTWPAEVVWPGGTPPTLSTAGGSVDWVIVLRANSGYLADARLDLA
jgi:hypothetical protein